MPASEGKFGKCSCGCLVDCSVMSVTAYARLGGATPFAAWAIGDWSYTYGVGYTGPAGVPSGELTGAVLKVLGFVSGDNVDTSYVSMPYPRINKVYLRKERTASYSLANGSAGTSSRFWQFDSATGTLWDRGGEWDDEWTDGPFGAGYTRGSWYYTLAEDGTAQFGETADPTRAYPVYGTEVGQIPPYASWEATVTESSITLTWIGEDEVSTGTITVTLTQPYTEADAVAYAQELLAEVDLDFGAAPAWHYSNHAEGTGIPSMSGSAPVQQWVVTHVWKEEVGGNEPVAKHACIQDGDFFYQSDEASRTCGAHPAWTNLTEWVADGHTATVAYHAWARKVRIHLCSGIWLGPYGPTLPFTFDAKAENWTGAVHGILGYWETGWLEAYTAPASSGVVETLSDVAEVGWQLLMNDGAEIWRLPPVKIAPSTGVTAQQLTLVVNGA